MCEPVTIAAIASTALTVAQTASAYQGQKQQAKFAERSATVQRNANIANIRAEETMQQQDEAERVETLRREVEQKKSTARLAAADAGVTGTSVDSVLNELAGQGAEAFQNLETNYARTALATSNQLYNADSQYASTVASNPKPSGLAAALQIGGSLLGGYGDVKGAQAAKKAQ